MLSPNPITSLGHWLNRPQTRLWNASEEPWLGGGFPHTQMEEQVPWQVPGCSRV